MPAQNRTVAGPPTLGLAGWMRVIAIGRNPRITLVRALILAVLCVVGYKATLVHIRVEGISMLPTLQDGSKFFVNRLAYLRHGPQRGDVVGIRFDPGVSRPHIMYLKRVIGLPGETVAFDDGKVLINGEVLEEPYEKLECDWTRPPVTLDANQYFVVGDNRSMPQELHEFGIAERDQIIGRVIR